MLSTITTFSSHSDRMEAFSDYKNEAVMDVLKHTGQDAYRLIITRRSGSEILVVGNGPDWSLPRTEIPSRQRFAEQLTAAIRKSFELETYCLFVPTPPSSVRTGSNANYAVMESVKQNDPAPAGLYWMPAGVLDPCCDVEEAKAVREALGELNSYATGKKPGPFGKAGWLRELFQWAEEQGLAEGCELLESFHLPDTLGHIDLNPGNILVSAESCVFLDWAEGCVSNPCLTFEYFRQHWERSSLEGPAVGARITAAYLLPWQAFFSLEELRRAVAIAPLV